MDGIVLIGSSGHARVVIDCIERAGKHRIVGLIDRFRSPGDETFGYRILGAEEDLPALVAKWSLTGIVIAIGDNATRAQVAARVAEYVPDLPLVTVIHPFAAIGRSVEIGAGVVAMAGVVVNPGARVGRLCVLNTNSSLDHDSVMDEFSSLAPRVVTGGNCRIGRYSAIGIGAVIRHGVAIGEQTVIGAGAIVLKNIDSFSVTYGAPARHVRNRVAGEPYL